MNQKLTELLFDKYPHLYTDRTKPVTQSLMSFGFEHGDGWFDIIDELSAGLTKLSRETGEQLTAFQVKEKWGGLRFYLNKHTKEASKLISIAENKSLKTCEKCGSTENVSQTRKGWVSTLCSKCLATE